MTLYEFAIEVQRLTRRVHLKPVDLNASALGVGVDKLLCTAAIESITFILENDDMDDQDIIQEARMFANAPVEI